MDSSPSNGAANQRIISPPGRCRVRPLRLRSTTRGKPPRKPNRRIEGKISLSRRAPTKYWPGQKLIGRRTRAKLPTKAEGMEGKFPCLLQLFLILLFSYIVLLLI